MSLKESPNFNRLSNVRELSPLNPINIDILSMRTQLVEAGLNLGISEVERKSLAKPQFRNLESGRGIGMVAVLGYEKAEDLIDWCQKKGEGGPRLLTKGKVSEDSEGRGLRQLAADIIQLVINPEPTQDELDKFCLRTNQRVFKGLLWDNKGNIAAKAKIHQAFAGIPEPKSTFASVPSGSVAELWGFLTSKI